MNQGLPFRPDRKSVCFAAAALFVLFLLVHYWDSIASVIGLLLQGLFPLLVGFVLAYLLNIVMSFYERRLPRSRNPKLAAAHGSLCLVLAVLTVLLVLVLVSALIVPQFIRCVHTLVLKAPDAIAKLTASQSLAPLIPEDLSEKLAGLDWDVLIDKAVGVLRTGLPNTLQKVSSSVSALVSVLLALIFSLYFLGGKYTLRRQVRRLADSFIRPEHLARIRHFLSILDDCFYHYVVGQCADAMILGVLCVLGMLVLRLPYAEMIGTLVGVSALIPVAGAYIGAAVGAFMIFSVSAKQALIFLVFLVILQQLEGNLIYPRIVGKSVGLPGIWVLAAVTVGGTLMGVFGMLLSVPVASALYRLLREALQRREAA